VRRGRAARRAGLAAALVVVAAGCARVPAPKPAAAPPAEEPVPGGQPAPGAAPYSELPPATPGPPRTGWLDVGVVVSADTARLESTGRAQVSGVVEVAGLAAGQTLMARAGAGRLLLQPLPAARELAVYEAADTVFVRPLGEGSLVRVNGRSYRGVLKLFGSPDGRVTVVNRVGLEDYLRGVLPHEIGKLTDATLEAGKAQAVAARTYALSYIGRRSDQGFDVYATVEDQLYGGAGDESPLTDRCVRETAGLVAAYRGRLIRANYSSTCGGVTANVEDVWPEPALPWLRSRPDAEREGGEPYCAKSPQFRWTEIWDVPEFLAIVNRTYPALVAPLPLGGATRLKDVRVLSRSASGRVAELEIDTDIGPLILRGDSARRVLLRPARSIGAGGPGTLLRSSLFKIGLVRDGAGEPVAVVATGAGFGHGVGLCQWGALEMARRGRGFREILEHYFTGIRVIPVAELAG
jgi:stage II sporulation protein D